MINNKFPYTIHELIREALSTIQERTEKEIYGQEVSRRGRLSGTWVPGYPPDLYVWYPEGSEQSLLEYTKDMILNYDYPRDLVGVTNLFCGPTNGTILKSITSFPGTSKVTDMTGMFKGSTYLEEVNLGGFDTSGVVSFKEMFAWCESLKEVDLGSFVTSKVTDTTGMFIGCSSLTKINLGNFDFTGVTNVLKMFFECTSLTTITGNPRGINLEVDFSDSPLTPESVRCIVKGLTPTSSGPKYLTVSEETYNNLTALQLPEGWEIRYK